MKNEEKKFQRFVAQKEGTTIQKSQCVGCANSRGLQCAVFGEKPSKYAKVSVGKVCPKRS